MPTLTISGVAREAGTIRFYQRRGFSFDELELAGAGRPAAHRSGPDAAGRPLHSQPGQGELPPDRLAAAILARQFLHQRIAATGRAAGQREALQAAGLVHV